MNRKRKFEIMKRSVTSVGQEPQEDKQEPRGLLLMTWATMLCAATSIKDGFSRAINTAGSVAMNGISPLKTLWGTLPFQGYRLFSGLQSGTANLIEVGSLFATTEVRSDTKDFGSVRCICFRFSIAPSPEMGEGELSCLAQYRQLLMQ